MKTESFDLKLAIQRWRENLAQSPAFRSENLNELESHLRDSTATLQTRGLSEAEAFLIASRRVGDGPQLETEFRKINRKTTWADRILWMLIGFQFWTLGSDLVSAIMLPVIKFGSPGFRQMLSFSLELILFPLAFGLLTLAVWKNFSKPESKITERWLARPFAFAAGLFSFALGVQILLGCFECLFLYPSTPNSSVVVMISSRFLMVYALAAALTFVFARKRLRSAA